MSQWMDRLTKVLLLVSFAVMLGLSALGIVLRWFGHSWMWIDPVVRHLVLVCAFAGGVLAVATNTHIRIDALAKPMERAPEALRAWLNRMVSLASALVTAGLVYSGWLFFVMEQEFGAPALLDLHSSWWVAIFPIGWAALFLRWLLTIFDSFTKREQ